MKTKHYCEICNKEFDDPNLCDEHEKRHKAIKELEKRHKPRFAVGDRMATPNSKSISSVTGMHFDVDLGWMYELGYDDFLHSISVAETDLSLIAQVEDIPKIATAITRELQKINKNLAAVYADYNDCFDFEVVYDANLPTAIELVKKHLGDGRETTHAIYYPKPNHIQLVEFVVDLPMDENASPIWYPPSKKIKQNVGLCLLNAKQYKKALEKPIRIEDGWHFSQQEQVIDIVGLL